LVHAFLWDFLTSHKRQKFVSLIVLIETYQLIHCEVLYISRVKILLHVTRIQKPNGWKITLINTNELSKSFLDTIDYIRDDKENVFFSILHFLSSIFEDLSEYRVILSLLSKVKDCGLLLSKDH